MLRLDAQVLLHHRRVLQRVESTTHSSRMSKTCLRRWELPSTSKKLEAT
jgi:hypothetical protein